MNVYFKGRWKDQSPEQNKLHAIKADTDNHEEAILLVKNYLEEDGHTQLSPILCVIAATAAIPKKEF